MRPRFLLFALLASLPAQTTVDPAAVLRRARLIVDANLDRVQRYTCIQTMERKVYGAPGGKWRSASCHEFITARASGKGPKMLLTSQDRLRLDLIVSAQSEMHTWQGGGAIDEPALKILTNGLLGTGDFSAFASSIFLTGEATVRFERATELDGHGALEYSYTVPLERSHYLVRSPNGQSHKIPYGGAVWLDPDTAQVLRITVTSDQLPEDLGACEVTTSILLETIQIRDQAALLPKVTELRSIGEGGAENVNTITYSGCREFSAQSTLNFDFDAPASDQKSDGGVEVKPGQIVELSLETPVTSTKSWGGDAIRARVVRGGGLPAGAVVHGRILRVEQELADGGYWIGLRFDELEIHGKRAPIRLRPADPVPGRPDTVRVLPIPELPGAARIWFGPAPAQPVRGRFAQIASAPHEAALKQGWLSRWLTL